MVSPKINFNFSMLQNIQVRKLIIELSVMMYLK